METDKTGHWPPGRCASPGERFRWLRCSYSECRTKKPLTQKALAEIAELSPSTVQNLEEGSLKTVSYRMRLCRALGIGKRMDILTASEEDWLKFVDALRLRSKPITMPKKDKKALP
jgi:transcriptional regulator with XRE-family HTH domain